MNMQLSYWLHTWPSLHQSNVSVQSLEFRASTVQHYTRSIQKDYYSASIAVFIQLLLPIFSDLLH
jgi:hypothetical protein